MSIPFGRGSRGMTICYPAFNGHFTDFFGREAAVPGIFLAKFYEKILLYNKNITGGNHRKVKYP
ncbi:hypothetical protein BFF99_10240 [Corynebacterium pseudotuberculosis]|nr:hypothetical protein BFF99_10240 [Corynebacterium pseudotuberculosis]